jgi:hypothetical protein
MFQSTQLWPLNAFLCLFPSCTIFGSKWCGNEGMKSSSRQLALWRLIQKIPKRWHLTCVRQSHALKIKRHTPFRHHATYGHVLRHHSCELRLTWCLKTWQAILKSQNGLEQQIDRLINWSTNQSIDKTRPGKPSSLVSWCKLSSWSL